MEPYETAQRAIAELKAAIHTVLRSAKGPLSNAEVGRTLGIYMGHLGHEGHISRSLLEVMKAEQVVDQDKHTKLWQLRPQRGTHATARRKLIP
jgi:hypothetical protein